MTIIFFVNFYDLHGQGYKEAPVKVDSNFQVGVMRTPSPIGLNVSVYQFLYFVVLTNSLG